LILSTCWAKNSAHFCSLLKFEHPQNWISQ
jgi:hypothetical protein